MFMTYTELCNISLCDILITIIVQLFMAETMHARH